MSFIEKHAHDKNYSMHTISKKLYDYAHVPLGYYKERLSKRTISASEEQHYFYGTQEEFAAFTELLTPYIEE